MRDKFAVPARKCTRSGQGATDRGPAADIHAQYPAQIGCLLSEDSPNLRFFKASFQDLCQKAIYEVTFQVCKVL
jgi:hypothetical protein